MRGVLILSVVIFWGGLQTSAQDPVRPDSSATTSLIGQLTIQADVDSSLVFIDSVRMGQTPLVVNALRPGFHRLKIVHPDVTNWLTSNIVDSVEILPGEEKVLRYSFGKRYLVLSVPSGAEVFIGDSLSGATPYLLSFQGTDSLSSVRLKKIGYDSAMVDLSEAHRGMVTVVLKKTWKADLRGGEPDEVELVQKPRTFPVYLAGAITVGFGAAAAYFKIQADDRNGRYLQDFSSASRSQIQIYDTAAAICLCFAEAGFGFLSYYLLTD
jgi:hypothetical protein